MTTQWYYKVMGEEVGPISSSELREQALRGTVTPDTFVRRVDDENWHVAQSVPGLFDNRVVENSTATQRTASRVPQKRRPVGTRETAEKLCERIENAMCGIRAEITDEELNGAQIAQMCDALREIVQQLEELEGSL